MAAQELPMMSAEVMRAASIEAADAGWPRLEWSPGSQFPAFNALHADITEKLHAIDPRLTPASLTPEGFRYDSFRLPEGISLSPDKHKAVQDLRRERDLGLFSLGREISRVLMPQVVEPGLSEPPYHSLDRYARADATMGPIIQMLIHGITDVEIDQKDLLRCAQAGGVDTDEQLSNWPMPNGPLRDERYYDLLTTKAFRRATQLRVGVREVLGADFDKLNELAAWGRLLPERRVLVVASHRSDFALDSVWRPAIILSVDKECVIVHDPSPVTSIGKERREWPKEDFIGLWAKALNRVVVVSARPLRPGD